MVVLVFEDFFEDLELLEVEVVLEDFLFKAFLDSSYSSISEAEPE